MIEALWKNPLQVSENNFVYKSLSNWACNIAVGCEHSCTFCYVPSASTNRMAPALEAYGVKDPDEEWGGYVLLRPWDKELFRRSVKAAERKPVDQLKPDGNRAVMFCTTTDPYQTFKVKKELNTKRRELVRGALRILLEESTLNVRILTRSPLAAEDFELMAEFKNRLLLGSSIPTLDNKLARIYEPSAPAPTKRLEMLQAASDLGIKTFVAMAPTYPDCDSMDMRRTIQAFKELQPITIFHEPINVRAENVKRIYSHAAAIGVKNLKLSIYDGTVLFAGQNWTDYAISQLKEVERIASDYNLSARLHIWPDKSLEKKWAKAAPTVDEYAARQQWLEKDWHRISEWPK